MKRLTVLLLSLLLTAIACAAPAAKPVAKAAVVTKAATTVTASATLNWSAVSVGTKGETLSGVTYNVWDGNIASGTCTAGAMTQIATGLPALTDTLTLPGLAAGSTECFAVSASAGGQTGALSNIVPVLVPTPANPIPGTTTVTVTIVVVSSP
jgi:hypothetical protein